MELCKALRRICINSDTGLPALGFAALGVVLACVGQAQVFPEVGFDDFEILDENAETDRPPAVVYNPDLDVLLVVAEADGTRIVAQFLDADGTTMGPSFDLGSDPEAVAAPAVEYDGVNERYLVTWFGRDGFRVKGLILNDDGSNFFGPFNVSSPCGTTDYWRWCNGSIAFNPTSSEYFVTWHEIEQNGPDDYDTTVLARRVGADGALLGSELTVGNNADSLGAPPRVVYNPTLNRFLVAWYGFGTTNGIYGIYIRTFNASGGPTRNATLVGDGLMPNFPDVVFNPVEEEYLVVWYQDADSEGDEIFGQRLDMFGAPIGDDDFRISDMGPFGLIQLEAQAPSVSVHPGNGRYLVAWAGADNAIGEYEIYGQHLDHEARALPPNDFRISEMGGTGDPDFDANYPAVAQVSSSGEFIVMWSGDDAVDEEFKFFGQRIHGSGSVIFRDGFESGDTDRW